MAKSSEYPDLTWVAPRSWSAGRASGQPSVVVIHTTEGHEKASSAEDGAAYDARRTDGTSTHFFHDVNSTVQCVRTTDRAHTARASGNRVGIHHELCGRAAQGAGEWADEASAGTLRQAAHQVARDCRKHGIPVRKLSASQLAAGLSGICGHVDVTYAFGESTHTDPGSSFPWSRFLDMVQESYQDQFVKIEGAARGAGEDVMSTGHLKAAESVGEVVIRKGAKPSAVHLLVTGGDLRVVVGAREAGADSPWGTIADVTLRDGDDRVDVELDALCNGVFLQAFAPDGTAQDAAGVLAYIVDCNRS